MKANLKRHLTQPDILLILVNLLPVLGVWMYGWDPKQVFLVYCLETIIIGGYNVIKMLLVSFASDYKDVQMPGGKSNYAIGIFMTLFFMIHYGFFVFGQMSIFLGIGQYKNIGNGPSGLFTFLMNVQDYLSPNLVWLLLAFVISYGFLMLKNFIFSGAFRKANIMVVMFSPYPRIFVQQFAVILGSMFLLFGAGKIFILIFAVVKICIEVLVDYEAMIKKGFEENIAKNKASIN